MDIEQFRKAAYQAIDRICDYYYSLEKRPVVAQVEPGYLAKLLPDHAPTQGESMETIANDFEQYILPGVTHWQHPSFFAYFPSLASFESLIGDIYAGSVSNPGFNWACSPASTELEAIVMDWAARLLGLDEKFLTCSGVGGGVLQTTASDAGLLACVVARTRYIKLHPETPKDKLVIYGTTQTHSLGAKAALILGVQFRALEVSISDSFSLRGESLASALKEDRNNGLHPYIMIATVGTTSSGAVDNIEEIGATLSLEPSIWLHVDAAWAGVAFALPEYRKTGHLDAINSYAHSFCTNFHKWGLTAFDCSTFWVKDRTLLTDALDVTPEFLRTRHGDTGMVIDYRNWHLSLGRKFRSLKLWFVLRGFGVEGFQKHLRKGIENASAFSTLIKNSPIFELAAPPTLALVVFRLIPPNISQNEAYKNDLQMIKKLNSLNLQLHETTSQLFLTRTDLGGNICIRISTGGYRTEERHVRAAFEVLERAGSELLALDTQTSKSGHAA
ncbi:aromatic-L-amino-acid decarboxylase [Serendipita vermifera]|nr:aromatic-L-amino-acid decarboxylase [Serendipita vermifera]